MTKRRLKSPATQQDKLTPRTVIENFLKDAEICETVRVTRQTSKLRPQRRNPSLTSSGVKIQDTSVSNSSKRSAERRITRSISKVLQTTKSSNDGAKGAKLTPKLPKRLSGSSVRSSNQTPSIHATPKLLNFSIAESTPDSVRKVIHVRSGGQPSQSNHGGKSEQTPTGPTGNRVSDANVQSDPRTPSIHKTPKLLDFSIGFPTSSSTPRPRKTGMRGRPRTKRYTSNQVKNMLERTADAVSEKQQAGLHRMTALVASRMIKAVTRNPRTAGDATREESSGGGSPSKHEMATRGIASSARRSATKLEPAADPFGSDGAPTVRLSLNAEREDAEITIINTIQGEIVSQSDDEGLLIDDNDVTVPGGDALLLSRLHRPSDSPAVNQPSGHVVPSSPVNAKTSAPKPSAVSASPEVSIYEDQHAHVTSPADVPSVHVEPSTDVPSVHVEPSIDAQSVHVEQSANQPSAHVEPYANVSSVHVEPSANEPSAHVKPSANVPSVHVEPSIDEPSVHVEPSADEPSAHIEPYANVPSVHVEPSANEPFAHVQPSVNVPCVHVEPSIDEPSVHVEPSADEPSADEPSADVPSVHVEPSNDEPSVHVQPSADEPTADVEPSADVPSANAPSAHVEPSTDEQSVYAEQSVRVEPSTDEPSANEPSVCVEPSTDEPHVHVDSSAEAPSVNVESFAKVLPTHIEPSANVPPPHVEPSASLELSTYEEAPADLEQSSHGEPTAHASTFNTVVSFSNAKRPANDGNSVHVDAKASSHVESAEQISHDVEASMQLEASGTGGRLESSKKSAHSKRSARSKSSEQVEPYVEPRVDSHVEPKVDASRYRDVSTQTHHEAFLAADASVTEDDRSRNIMERSDSTLLAHDHTVLHTAGASSSDHNQQATQRHTPTTTTKTRAGNQQRRSLDKADQVTSDRRIAVKSPAAANNLTSELGDDVGSTPGRLSTALVRSKRVSMLEAAAAARAETAAQIGRDALDRPDLSPAKRRGGEKAQRKAATKRKAPSNQRNSNSDFPFCKTKFQAYLRCLTSKRISKEAYEEVESCVSCFFDDFSRDLMLDCAARLKPVIDQSTIKRVASKYRLLADQSWTSLLENNLPLEELELFQPVAPPPPAPAASGASCARRAKTRHTPAPSPSAPPAPAPRSLRRRPRVDYTNQF